MRELTEIRRELDGIDREIVALFERRMALSREVAQVKRSQGKPVLDAAREAQVIETRCAMLTDSALREDVKTLFGQIMALSRQEQERLLLEAQHA